LFCPTDEIMRNSGATSALCVTNVGSDGKAVLNIENYTLHSITLRQGEILGTVEPVQPVTTVGIVNALKSDQDSPKLNMEPDERMEQLFSELDVEGTLSQQEFNKLKAVVSSFSDVFALDQSELGKTDLIKHSIDIGGQGPVKTITILDPIFPARKNGRND